MTFLQELAGLDNSFFCAIIIMGDKKLASSKKEWQKRNKERVNEYNKNWRQRNKERWREYFKKYFKEHPEYNRALQQRFREKHPLYSTWQMLKQRCLNPNHNAYHRYGGRGIIICDTWLNYQAFEKWMSNTGWQPGLTIDRINNDKGYYPENCQVITRSENSRRKGKVNRDFKRIIINETYNRR